MVETQQSSSRDGNGGDRRLLPMCRGIDRPSVRVSSNLTRSPNTQRIFLSQRTASLFRSLMGPHHNGGWLPTNSNSKGDSGVVVLLPVVWDTTITPVPLPSHDPTVIYPSIPTECPPYDPPSVWRNKQHSRNRLLPRLPTSSARRFWTNFPGHCHALGKILSCG